MQLCHTLQNICPPLFPRRITTSFAVPVRKSVGVLWFVFNLKFRSFLGIYTQSGTLSCTVKRPDEVCVSHTKSVGDNIKTILQLKKFAEVLLTGLSFYKYSLQSLDKQCRKAAHSKRMKLSGNIRTCSREDKLIA